MSASQIELLLSGVRDTNGEPLANGKVYTYIAGTSTPFATYSDVGKTQVQTNPIILDANGRNHGYAEGNFKFVIKDEDDATIYTFDNLVLGTDNNGVTYAGTSTGSSNAYVLTNSPVETSYTSGDSYSFIANFANTGVATVNIDGLGAKTIKRADGSTLQSGDIPISTLAQITYNGTDFLLTSDAASIANTITTLGTAVQNGSYVYGGTSGGAANVQTLTLSPVPTGYVTGEIIEFISGYENSSTTVTLNKNSLGAKTIKKYVGGAKYGLVEGELAVGTPCTVRYDGTDYILLNSRAANLIDIIGATTTVTNTVTETTLYSKTITAGTLGSYRGFKAKIFGTFLNNTGSDRSFRFRVKIGGATVADFDTALTPISSDSNTRAYGIEITAKSLNSTGSQIIESRLLLSTWESNSSAGVQTRQNTSTGLVNYSSSLNSTVNNTLSVTVEMSAASTSLTTVIKAATLEII